MSIDYAYTGDIIVDEIQIAYPAEFRDRRNNHHQIAIPLRRRWGLFRLSRIVSVPNRLESSVPNRLTSVGTELQPISFSGTVPFWYYMSNLAQGASGTTPQMADRPASGSIIILCDSEMLVQKVRTPGSQKR